MHRAIEGRGWKHDTHPNLPGRIGGKADFRVDNVYVEVWGPNRPDRPEYPKRQMAKRSEVAALGLSLVEVSREDLDSAGKLLEKIDEIGRRRTVRQERLSTKSQSKQTTRPLDRLPLAEHMARIKGLLIEIDQKIEVQEGRVKEATDLLQNQVKDLDCLKSERETIVRQFW